MCLLMTPSQCNRTVRRVPQVHMMYFSCSRGWKIFNSVSGLHLFELFSVQHAQRWQQKSLRMYILCHIPECFSGQVSPVLHLLFTVSLYLPSFSFLIFTSDECCPCLLCLKIVNRVPHGKLQGIQESAVLVKLCGQRDYGTRRITN